jgi:hypothetical protein
MLYSRQVLSFDNQFLAAATKNSATEVFGVTTVKFPNFACKWYSLETLDFTVLQYYYKHSISL